MKTLLKNNVQKKQTETNGKAFFQAKLSINQPNDAYEQEADAMADHVMRMPDASLHANTFFRPSVTAVQRKCAHCEEEEKKMQRKEINSDESDAGPSTENYINSLNGKGRSLSNEERKFFEPRMGYDFSDVKLHTDTAAAKSAQSVNALAYTSGNNIVFNEGQYAPASDTGKKLLGHELTHVVQQQKADNTATVQRSITLTDPTGTPPHAPGEMGPFPSKAWTLENWLTTLCPEGGWTVNSTTGVVSSPNANTFCGANPMPGLAHHSTSGHPTSCGCICELTAAGSRTIEVQIDENLTVGGRSIPLIPQGEGATIHNTATDKVSAFTGRDPVSITGAGATNPHSGAGRNQVLPDPAWVIFGHEVCGHARLQTGNMGATQVGHSTTPEGNLTTVDIENRIRREHSTVTNSLGIRGATFSAKDAAGIFNSHQGAMYVAGAGETIPTIANRCGIPAATMLSHIWRENGDQITAATQNTLAVNERLLVEGINWHEVIAGEDFSSIATMWAIPLASLQSANPQFLGPIGSLNVGDRMLIPAS
jgi:hypothetical protein